MYDTAKRGLAFTVATGGLLLTGAGFTPAEAAVGSGAIAGPAAAQGNASTQHASQNTAGAPISVAGPNSGKAAQALEHAFGGSVPVALDGQTVHERPQAQTAQNAPAATGPQNASQHASDGQDEPRVWDDSDAGPSSSAEGVVSHSGGILSGNSVQVPITLPVNLCGDQVNVVALLNLNGGAKCEIGGGHGEGSHASASGATIDSGGIGSGNQIQIPVNAPINVCGDQINVVGIGNLNGPAECGINAPEHPRPTMPPPCEHCSPPPTTQPPTTPPPTTQPPTTPPTCEHCSPPPTTPAGSTSPTETTPPGESHTPPPGGHLASTGTEEGGALAAAGAALLAGIGLRTASKRGRRSR